MISIGLPETPENYFQEGGRPMRGSLTETQGQQGYSFFLHKGALGTEYFFKYCHTAPSWIFSLAEILATLIQPKTLHR